MLFFIISFNDTEVTFNFPMRQINEEVIMPKKLNERLGSTVTDYMLLIFIVISLVINNDSL